MSELTSIAPIEVIKSAERELIQEGSFEPMARSRCLYADKEVAQMMHLFGSVKSASGFQKLSLEEQRAVVAKMRGEKAPIRQIARVTGISKGVLERWGRI